MDIFNGMDIMLSGSVPCCANGFAPPWNAPCPSQSKRHLLPNCRKCL